MLAPSQRQRKPAAHETFALIAAVFAPASIWLTDAEKHSRVLSKAAWHALVLVFDALGPWSVHSCHHLLDPEQVGDAVSHYPPSDVALIGTQSFLMEIVERTVLWFDEVLHDVEAHEAP